MYSSIFWDKVLCDLFEVNGHFWGTCNLQLQSQRICYAFHLLSHWFSFLVYSSTLKMETIYSFEMLFDFQQTTWHYIPENSTLHNHHTKVG
jgi:hypothetical protein